MVLKPAASQLQSPLKWLICLHVYDVAKGEQVSQPVGLFFLNSDNPCTATNRV